MVGRPKLSVEVVVQLRVVELYILVKRLEVGQVALQANFFPILWPWIGTTHRLGWRREVRGRRDEGWYCNASTHLPIFSMHQRHLYIFQIPFREKVLP